MKKTTTNQMRQGAWTLTIHHKPNKQKNVNAQQSQAAHCEKMDGTIFHYFLSTEPWANLYRGQVRLIRMNVRWCKGRENTSKRYAGSWINLGFNLKQPVYIRFNSEALQNKKRYINNLVVGFRKHKNVLSFTITLNFLRILLFSGVM